MKDITSKKFGFLTAIKFHKKHKDRHSIWEYRCECGNTVFRKSNDVARRNNQSCGCKFNLKSIKHGMFGTRFYRIWSGMMTRCTNKNSENYKNYGGRGIKICARWMNFENFKTDFYNSYLFHSDKFGEKNTTLERINNNEGYNAGNCRFATYKEQAQNRRTNRFITINKKTKTISSWASELNISQQLMNYRIKRKYYGS